MTNQQQEQVVPGVRIGANASTERRRRLKNYLLKSKFQLKFSYYMIAAGFAFFGATVYFVEKKLTEIDVLLRDNQIIDAIVRSQILDRYSDITQITLGGFAGYVTFTFIYALVLAHRVSGPIMSIVAFIDELKKGNYGYARNLRRGDELVPIMSRLQELARILSNLGKRTDPSDPR